MAWVEDTHIHNIVSCRSSVCIIKPLQLFIVYNGYNNYLELL